MPVTTRFGNPKTARRYLGRAYTGKTSSLINDLVALCEKDTRRESIAVFCATPQSSLEFMARLEKRQMAESASLSGVFIGTPQEYALQLLDTDEAYALTGRKARVLDRLETDILIEDAKTCGMRPGRLRAMLGFFFRSWAELIDDDEHWLKNDEERELHALVKDELRLLEGLLEPELSNLARKVLLGLNDPGDATTPDTGKTQRDMRGFDHVFVDDYQLLSRASQQLCCLLARKSMTIGADPFACVRAHESYPYAAGVEELLELIPNTDTVELSACSQSKAVGSACAAFTEREGLETLPSHHADGAPEGSVESLFFGSPDEECASIAQLVARNSKDAGDAQDDTDAPTDRDIVIAVPNAAWASKMVRELKAQGVEANFHPDRRLWTAGFKNDAAGTLARMLCALRLVADPADYPAWRSWCAFGDSMANSPAFDGIRDACATRGIALIDALEGVSSGTLQLKKGSIGTRRVAEAYREGLEICNSSQGLRGMDLLKRLSCCVRGDARGYAVETIIQLILIGSRLLAARHPGWDRKHPANRSVGVERSGLEKPLELFCVSEMTASEMLECIREAFEGPLKHGGDSIAVLTYQEAIGVKADEVYVMGFVNGYVPNADWFDLTVTPLRMQAKRRRADARLVEAVASIARNKLMFSAFTSVNLDFASKAKLKVERIRIENGIRMATTSPSVFLPSLLGPHQEH